MNFLIPLTLLFAPPSEDPSHAQASADLQAAIDNSTAVDRPTAIATLASALERWAQFPEAAQPTIPEPVLEAHVILIRLYLAEGDTQAAEQAMDELIRTARDQVPPVRSYGLEVTNLHSQRQQVLQAAGTATLRIECEVECEVVINERSTSSEERLLLGPYRIWVRAKNGTASWEQHTVELTEPDAVVTLTYEDPNPIEAPPPPPPPREPEKKQRMLPRGAEIAGVAVGAGLLVAGAVLLAFDGRCSATKQHPDSNSTLETCGDIYEMTAGGAALLGVGGGLLVVSGVLLGVDEVRVGRARGHQAIVRFKLRF